MTNGQEIIYLTNPDNSTELLLSSNGSYLIYSQRYIFDSISLTTPPMNSNGFSNKEIKAMSSSFTPSPTITASANKTILSDAVILFNNHYMVNGSMDITGFVNAFSQVNAPSPECSSNATVEPHSESEIDAFAQMETGKLVIFSSMDISGGTLNAESNFNLSVPLILSTSKKEINASSSFNEISGLSIYSAMGKDIYSNAVTFTTNPTVTVTAEKEIYANNVSFIEPLSVNAVMTSNGVINANGVCFVPVPHIEADTVKGIQCFSDFAASVFNLQSQMRKEVNFISSSRIPLLECYSRVEFVSDTTQQEYRVVGIEKVKGKPYKSITLQATRLPLNK